MKFRGKVDNGETILQLGMGFRNIFYLDFFSLLSQDLISLIAGAFFENPILGSLAAVVARLCKKVVLRAAFRIT